VAAIVTKSNANEHLTLNPVVIDFFAKTKGLPSHFQPCPTLTSNYTLQHPLGEGASGFVLFGTRKTDQADVAIKFLFKDRVPAGSGWKKDRGLGKLVPTEVFVLRRLTHENIVKFYDVFEDATVCIYM
jgi:serine/threonine protein kinase